MASEVLLMATGENSTVSLNLAKGDYQAAVLAMLQPISILNLPLDAVSTGERE